MGRGLKRPIPFLLACLWGIWPAFLLYLLVLQLPFYSNSRAALAVLTVPFFAYLAYRFFSYPGRLSLNRWLLIAAGSVLIALLAMQALSFYPQKTYLFFGRHTLVATIHLSQPGEVFEVRGMKTSLGDVSFDDFQGVPGWERRGNRLVPLSFPPALLVWSGWTGDSARLEMWSAAEAVVEASWDGRTRQTEIPASATSPTKLEYTFTMPTWGRSFLFLVLLLTASYVLALPVLLLQSEAVSNLGRAAAFLRIAFLVGAILAFGAILLNIYLPLHPALTFPGRDSGVFLYIGRKVLEGGIPYRDVWDHKGPLIFYLNALGLWLGNGSAAGVWALELAWMCATVSSLFIWLRKVTSTIPAAAACAVFLVGLRRSLAGGNFVEEYVLLFQILALGASWLFLISRRDSWLLFAGLGTAGAFLLIPNRISAGVGIGIYLFLAGWRGHFAREYLRPLLCLAAGMLLPLLAASLYFTWKHALADAFSAIFVFNGIYVGKIGIDLLQGFKRGLFAFPSLGMWIICGLAALFVRLLRSRGRSPQDHFAVVVAVSALAELFLSNLSGAGFKHYYITWLPYVAFLTAYLVSSAIQLLAALFHKWARLAPDIIYAGAILWLVPMLWSGAGQIFHEDSRAIRIATSPARQFMPASVPRLAAYLSPDSKLLMWGNEVAYNFVLGVDAPTRFVYQYPLMTPPYASNEMVVEFIGDIAAARPVIVDASAGNSDAIPLEKTRRAQFLSQNGNLAAYAYLQPFYDFFDAHYQVAGELSNNWIVFESKR